ncbi:MAG: DEAD/DEAH box helicase family protein [Firmicutes bacterium]|nr:DEAD/DEAH box helicase family protein [Bacillota bacterium]
MSKTKAKSNTPELKFYQKLVLNRFILLQFGVEDLKELSQGLRSPKLELLDRDGNTGFFKELSRRLGDKIKFDIQRLAEYDLNIVRALDKINHKRSEKIRLKYFQYLSLLFCEYYLDRYFGERDELLKDINEFVDSFNMQYPNDAISRYKREDLNKIALWNATGSGKTLLMHINYHQYLHYTKGKKDGIFILLTPKEGLSNQHREDFTLSNIRAKVYQKDESMMFAERDAIHVIENTKLGDKDGQKTVAVSRFGSSNVVFVDEGHRGASGDIWYKFRNELCRDGFSFEYSATFGQAVSGNRELVDEYAKCILFDYSYKYFYSDGYGKDYNIINLADDTNTRLRDTYLTACLVTYYQQKRLYLDSREGFNAFNLENPLFVFVGASVNAVRTDKGSKVSDVVDIMLYFKDFVVDGRKFVAILESIRNGKTGLIDKKNKDIFSNAFSYLESCGLAADALYDDILAAVFNCKSKGGILHVENLKGIQGELRLRLGDNDAFGVINVGDDAELLKLFEANGFDTASVDFSESLFDGITKPNSTINLLIGSKKFTEGWNCWRVSTMGLMNVGRSEGSEIIQLFGRGVRLKGYDMSLKRSGALIKDRSDLTIPRFIQILETLNIFGIRADYMKQFKEYLEKEGVPTERGAPYIIKLPAIMNYKYKRAKLYALKLKDDVDYKKDAPKPSLKTASFSGIVELDCYGKVQFETSRTRALGDVTKSVGHLPKECLPFLDYEKIFFELVRYKNEKARYNFNISKADIKELLSRNDWYRLLIPEGDAQFRSLSDIARFEKISVALLKEYCDRIYTGAKKNWETPLLTYELLDGESAFEQSNMIDEYVVTIEDGQDDDEMVGFIKHLRDNLADARRNRQAFTLDGIKNDFEFHGLSNLLYSPFLYLAKRNTTIEISPVALNESERDFVRDLKKYIETHSAEFSGQDIYLIRNKSKKGIGFFEDGGFYPDFIMWRIHGGKQYITFVDPHGMRNESINSSKVGLHKTIKEIEARLGDKNIILNSVIVSPTPIREMTDKKITKEQWNAAGVFFQQEEGYIGQVVLLD